MDHIQDLFNLHGKTALIVGGTSGLGKGMAHALGLAGASLIIAGRDTDRLMSVENELRGAGCTVKGMQIDISLPEHLSSLSDRLSQVTDRVDILINAAGINVRKPILEITIDDWNHVLNVNLRGAFFVSQAVAHLMLHQKAGKIINIASLTSAIGLPNMGPYCASKGGIAQITKAMAVEWAPVIQVNAIAPGYYATEMTRPIFDDPQRLQSILMRIPHQRTGFPEDLYGAAIFLASPASDYITGQTLYVDGGWTAS